MVAYGTVRRSTSNETDVTSGCGSLFDPNAPLRSAKDWLAQTHHAALMAEGKKENAAKQRLEQVKDLLIKVLPDVHDIELTATDAAIPQIKVMFSTDYGQVELENLSHGYQTMIAWMADFASRLVEAYPDSPNPLAEPAVCMVDEIDLHLHPRWQREIIAYLTNLFPKTQFIVTAHSPLIVQSAENANIALLRKEGDHVVIENDKKLIQGWRIDQILTSDLFGLDSARPPQYAVMMDERRKLLAKKRRTKADKARLAELDEKLDAMPAGESAADREAMDIIRRAAERLKREETAKAAEAGA
jgi:predicted ATP-binding protein involved in virulence